MRRNVAGILAVILLASFTAHAADPVPADAPVAVVKSGQLVPFDGLLLSDAQAIAQAKRVAGAEAKAEALEAGLKTSPPWWVIPLVGLVCLGAGVGIGIAAAPR